MTPHHASGPRALQSIRVLRFDFASITLGWRLPARGFVGSPGRSCLVNGLPSAFPMNWFVAILLLLLVAVTFRLGLLAYVAYVLFALWGISRWLARDWVRNVVATRECNRDAVTVGEAVAVVVTIENRGKWPVPWILAEDLVFWPPAIEGPPPVVLDGPRMKIAMLRAGARVTLNYRPRFEQRGYYQIGPLVLESGDVFGLHRRYQAAAPPHFVLVYPRVERIEGYNLATRRPIGELKMAHRLFEDPTRIRGVREYERGDPLNRVNWRATARTGKLHSKVYEPSCVAGATLLLDFFATDYARHNEPYRSELAVAAAAGLANAVYLMGQQVGLVTNGRDAVERVRSEGFQHDFRTRDAAKKAAAFQGASEKRAPLVVPTLRGAEQLARILELLARVEKSDGLSFMQLVQETSARLPRDATVVAIVPDASDEIVVALSSLRRRGYAVTAIVNVYENWDFSEAAGRLLAEKIAVRHLQSLDTLADVCRQHAML